MGSSASKSAKTAGSAVRKYPIRSPTATTTTTTRRQVPIAPATPASSELKIHPSAQVAQTKTEAIEKDGKDPALASRLNRLGAVQPNPHYSATSTSPFDPQLPQDSARLLPNATTTTTTMMADSLSPLMFPDARNNPVLRVLEARRQIVEQAEEELREVGRQGFAGRKYVDASTIQLALMRQAKGEPNRRIEAALGIQKGRLDVLGRGMSSAGQRLDF